MKKISSVLFFMCIFSLVSHSCAMENSYERGLVAHANVTQAHLDQFLTIVKGYTPFSMHGVFRIKQLAKDSKEWADILDDAAATGKLIEYAHEKKAFPGYPCKARTALTIATQGSLQWCKNYLALDENQEELRVVSNDFLKKIHFDNYSSLKSFLAAGVNVNVANQNNCPALITATKQLNVDLVTFLLENNANPNVTTVKHQHTPLMIIMKRLHQAEYGKYAQKFYNSFIIFKLLVSSQFTNIGQKNADGKMAFDYACDYKKEWLQVLLMGYDNKIYV